MAGVAGDPAGELGEFADHGVQPLPEPSGRRPGRARCSAWSSSVRITESRCGCRGVVEVA